MYDNTVQLDVEVAKGVPCKRCVINRTENIVDILTYLFLNEYF